MPNFLENLKNLAARSGVENVRKLNASEILQKAAALTAIVVTSIVTTTLTVGEKVELTELADAPAAPAAGKVNIYAKDDGKPYAMNSAEEETPLGGDVSGGIALNDDAEATFGTTPQFGLRYDSSADGLVLKGPTGDMAAIGESDKYSPQPSSTTPAAGVDFYETGQAGGGYSGTNGHGAAGGNTYKEAGYGGSGGSLTGNGGAGGSYTVSGGAGGFGEIGNGGAGGALILKGGAGGTSTSETAGNGGNVEIVPGPAGSGSGGAAGRARFYDPSKTANESFDMYRYTAGLWYLGPTEQGDVGCLVSGGTRTLAFKHIEDTSTAGASVSSNGFWSNAGYHLGTAGQTRSFGIDYDSTGIARFTSTGTTDALSFLEVGYNSIDAFAAGNNTAAYTAYFRSQKGGTATSGNGRAGGTYDFIAGAGSDAFATGGGNGGAGGDFSFTLGAGGAKDGGGTDGAAGNFKIYPPAQTGSGATGGLRVYRDGHTVDHVFVHKDSSQGYIDNISSSNEPLLIRGGSSGTTAIIALSNLTTFSTSYATNWVGTGGIMTQGDFLAYNSRLTAGTMTETAAARVKRVWTRYSWTNAMITALGASPTGNILVCTLPAKTAVARAFIFVTTAATFADTLTGSLGTNSTTYNNYVLAGNIKASANTVYGDNASGGETGSALLNVAGAFVEHLPSLTGTTAVYMRVNGNATNLSGVTTSSGEIYLETYTLP